MANPRKALSDKIKKSSSGEDIVSVTVVFAPDVVEAIDASAHKSKRSRSGEIRWRLEWSLAQTKAGLRLEH